MKITQAHYIAICQLLGLEDEWCIKYVSFEGNFFTVTTSQGIVKSLSLRNVNSQMQINAAKETIELIQDEYEPLTITSVIKNFRGSYKVEMINAQGQPVNILQKRVSTIFQAGVKVYIDSQRRLNLIGA